MSLAPARTVAPRSSIEPAVCCALARNFSKALRACSKLASAIVRISFGISKRSRPSSLMVALLLRLQGHPPPRLPFRPLSLLAYRQRPRWSDAAPIGSPSWTFDRLLQHPNARAATRVRGNSRGWGEFNVIAGFGHLADCQAVDLPLPAGDTNAPSRLSLRGRRDLLPPSSNRPTSLSCHCDEPCGIPVARHQ